MQCSIFFITSVKTMGKAKRSIWSQSPVNFLGGVFLTLHNKKIIFSLRFLFLWKKVVLFLIFFVIVSVRPGFCYNMESIFFSFSLFLLYFLYLQYHHLHHHLINQSINRMIPMGINIVPKCKSSIIVYKESFISLFSLYHMSMATNLYSFFSSPCSRSRKWKPEEKLFNFFSFSSNKSSRRLMYHFIHRKKRDSSVHE